MTKINKNVPLPKRKGGYESAMKKVFEQLKAPKRGQDPDSFFYPFPDQENWPKQPKAYMYRCRRMYAPDISTRMEVVVESGIKGVRVWRTK